MEAVQIGSHLDLPERAGEVHVAEDLVRLQGLVAAADEDGVRALADELEALEVGHDSGHDEREDPLARELPRGGAGGRLQLVVDEVEAKRAQLVCELGAGPRRVVRHEAKGVTGVAQPRNRVLCAGDRDPGDMQHPVDVQENARHGRGVYSGHALRLHSDLMRSTCVSRGPRGRAASMQTRRRRASRRYSTSRRPRR